MIAQFETRSQVEDVRLANLRRSYEIRPMQVLAVTIALLAPALSQEVDGNALNLTGEDQKRHLGHRQHSPAA